MAVADVWTRRSKKGRLDVPQPSPMVFKGMTSSRRSVKRLILDMEPPITIAQWSSTPKRSSSRLWETLGRGIGVGRKSAPPRRS